MGIFLMEALPPSPQTTLLILLGASQWPLFPEFQSSKAFANAAGRLKAYFLNPQPFGLPAENVLDLFDSDKSADELDVEMSRFLERRLIDMKKAGNPTRDVLLYFVGHGGFVGHDADFYLAIRRTRIDNPRASGLQVTALADTLKARARFLRRIVILDCCFAAAAFDAFQGGADEVAIEKTKAAFQVGYKAVGFPTKGTTLLCSSSHKSPSRLLPDGSSTMFSKAFLDALVQGTISPRDRLTLRDVKDATADLLTEIPDAPRPVVLSPDQSEGDVADIPFFPNPRIEEERQRRAEEERRRQDEEAMQARKAEQGRLRRRIEEERRRQVEEAERTRRMEEERRQRVEQEQARRAEEERERQAKEEQARLAKAEEPSSEMTPRRSASTPSETSSARASEREDVMAADLNTALGEHPNIGFYPDPRYLERALGFQEKQLGPTFFPPIEHPNQLGPTFSPPIEHPNTATSFDILAGVEEGVPTFFPQEAQGKYEQAEPLYQRALSIDEKAYVSDHLDVATNLNELAGLEEANGNYEEAESLYQRALAIREKQLGPVHPDTVATRKNYSALVENMKRKGEGQP